MKHKKSLRVTPRAFLLAGIFFAVWIGLLLAQGPAAEAEDVLGWTGTIKYTQTWTGAPMSFPETGSQTTTYRVDGTLPPAEENGNQYQPASWEETYNSKTDYRTSCDTDPVTTSYITRSGAGSGNTGLLVHFSGTRYQIDAGFHGNNVDGSNLQYNHTRSYCDTSEQLPVSAKQVVVGHFSACNWDDIASNPEGSAATTLSGTATNPCPMSSGVTETYEWDLTRAPVEHKADIAVSQTDSPDPVEAGSNVTYRVIVRNDGPDGTTGVKLSDTTPQGTTFVSATPSTGACSQAEGTVSCELGSLDSGAMTTVDIVVKAPASGGTMTNAASASAADPDPNTANNSSSAETSVAEQVKNLRLSGGKISRGGASSGFTEDYTFQYSKIRGTELWIGPNTLRSSALTWTSCRTDGGSNLNLYFGQSGAPTFIADSDQKIGRIGHTLTYTAYRNGREVASVSTSDSATVFKK